MQGNSIKLSTFLKYGLTKVKKSSIIDVRLDSKYASVNITLHLTFLKSACKRYVLQQSSGLQACNIIKNRLQNGCFSVNTPNVLTTAFFTEELWWLLLNHALVSERIFKEES